MECTVYLEKPDDFVVQREAAGCYFWCQDKLLLLKRHESKPQGGTWGVPAGKVEADESARDCVIREMQEELGLHVGDDLHDMGRLYVQLGTLSYIFHMFFKPCAAFPELTLLLDENSEARWVTHDEALALPLIKAGKEAIFCLKEYVKKQDNRIGEAPTG